MDMQKMLVMLSELDDNDLHWMASVGRRENMAAGTILIAEGQPVETLHIVLDGSVMVSVSALGDRPIARLVTGEVVGEMSFIEDRPPSATVQTLETTTVLAIPRSLLLQKLQQDLGFGCRFYRALAILLSQRLRGTVSQLSPETHPETAPPRSLEPHPEAVEVAEPAWGEVAIAQGRFNRLVSHR